MISDYNLLSNSLEIKDEQPQLNWLYNDPK
jgi:hypothetical protein